jgi:hypothetical protein
MLNPRRCTLTLLRGFYRLYLSGSRHQKHYADRPARGRGPSTCVCGASDARSFEFLRTYLSACDAAGAQKRTSHYSHRSSGGVTKPSSAVMRRKHGEGFR